MLHLVPLAGAGRKVADMDRHVELVSDTLQLMLRFELADHSLGLVVEGGDDLVRVLFRVVESQAADREIDDFMTVPRSRPG